MRTESPRARLAHPDVASIYFWKTEGIFDEVVRFETDSIGLSSHTKEFAMRHFIVLGLAWFLAAAGAIAQEGTAGPEEENPMIPEDTAIVTTASGLKYSVLQPGEEGPCPGFADEVKVHYTGWLEDGTVFDSSRTRGKPTEFRVNQVIQGWTEGLQLMSKGARFKFTIPSDLAYGKRGAPPNIPPESNLIFDVELLDFTPCPKVPAFSPGDPEKQVTLESGLVYEPVRAGKGEKPGPEDSVRLLYAFWNEEGRLVDCSELRDGPMSYSPGSSRLAIFDEAIKVMEAGSRYRFIVPPQLAFGPRGAPPYIPANARSIWEFEILEVIKPLPVPEFSRPAEEALTATASGLRYEVLKSGEGRAPKMGEIVRVHYAGWLRDGSLFDASFKSGEPAEFPLGRVIPGWNEGLQLMKEGAIYKFVIPPHLGYGPSGAPPRIPPNAELIFYVELLAVKE